MAISRNRFGPTNYMQQTTDHVCTSSSIPRFLYLSNVYSRESHSSNVRRPKSRRNASENNAKQETTEIERQWGRAVDSSPHITIRLVPPTTQWYIVFAVTPKTTFHPTGMTIAMVTNPLVADLRFEKFGRKIHPCFMKVQPLFLTVATEGRIAPQTIKVAGLTGTVFIRKDSSLLPAIPALDVTHVAPSSSAPTAYVEHHTFYLPRLTQICRPWQSLNAEDGVQPPKHVREEH
ncbi:hypothetical protein AAG570_001357 [Ranatra chinensis]|uniref:Uncharacterized protein n=1 Tax=Ranatra chinensis TaxID=642074 RepID=A0ABD0YCC3_9HEMI